MPVATRPALRLPPAYRLIELREHACAHAEACRRAAAEGAGAFFRVRRFDVLEFAVVLEPEEPLAGARRALFAGLTALADAIAAHAPSERSVGFDWPSTVRFDGARLGGARLGWPHGGREDEIPDWLVFSAVLLASPVGIADPGAHPAVTWLAEEGFAAEEREAVIESFAAHLLLAFDTWGERGFDAVAGRYLGRLATIPGGRASLDGEGNLLVVRDTGVERAVLLPALAEPAWLDPATGLPRLRP